MINLLRFLRVELHPEYEHLKEFLTSMPLRFHNNEGKVIYKGRNELRVFEYQGQEYVVKSFKKPMEFLGLRKRSALIITRLNFCTLAYAHPNPSDM